MVSGDRRAREPEIPLGEVQVVSIAEPWAGRVQSGYDRWAVGWSSLERWWSPSRGAGVLCCDNWLSEEPALGNFWSCDEGGASATMIFNRKQETSSPNFNLITLQTLFLMQQMLIFSVSAEEYKVWPDSHVSAFSQSSNVNFCACVDRGANVFVEQVCEICRGC